jgi:hypothetical protein
MSRHLIALVLSAAIAAPALATDQRIDHFKGEPAPTLEVALKNFKRGNAQLAGLLQRQELTMADLHAIHQLTYTLENALGKINEESTALAETLERLHLTSETGDLPAVREHGKSYLDTAGQLVP